MSINILQIPNAPGGYNLAGKKVMVHDQGAPLGSSTVLIPATDLKTLVSPIWKESDGDMIAGLFTFTDASLIGATEMNYIIVNKIIEFIDDDFTFVSATGIITRISQWQPGDKMITPFKPA